MAAILLPSRRDEAWKYSDLRTAFGDAPAPEGDPALADRPVIVQLAGAAQAFYRLELAPGDHAVRTERLEAAGIAATALEVVVPKGGSFTRIVIQGGEGVALNHVRVRLAEGATFRQFVLATGARLARIETEAEIEGEGVLVELNGLYLAGAGRHADLTSKVIHRAPKAATRQLVKGAVRRGGRAVFQGLIEVERAAQKTDARQHHQGLVLEEGGEIDAKPELRIFADDVACAHGNTVGGLSVDQLFYLRTRGLPDEEARALLAAAFLSDAMPDWLDGSPRADIENGVRDWLHGWAQGARP
jgi:Fe-S cluster assembly protein SufD